MAISEVMMGDKTAIEWTDHSFNPWWGCAKVSPGCDHCYAETWAKRVGMQLWGVDAPRRVFDHKHWADPLRWNRIAGERGIRARVFCASMADVFDNRAGLDEEREKLWTLIHKTPNLDWQLLTKRISNVSRMVPPPWMSGHWPAYVWLGSSIVNQEEADRDIQKLRAIPARVRFLSCEPLLGPITLRPYTLTERPCFVCRIEDETGGARGSMSHPINCGWRHDTNPEPRRSGIDWVIAGGESGPGARPSHPDWHRSLRDQCAAAGVPFLFKQWGEWAPPEMVAVPHWKPAHTYVNDPARVPAYMMRVGKKAAGRTLDGRTHDEYPA